MMRTESLEKVLGVKFRDRRLLEQALIHDSYLNENPDFAPTANERLEFLGDAVLGLVVAEELYHNFTGYTEGQLSQFRASLVRRDTLARMAQQIGLGDFLYLGKGEEASGGRQKIPNLAGAMEAVIGAIFLDQGLAEARRFGLSLLKDEYEALLRTGVAGDYKSQLQQYVQARQQRTPSYHVVQSSGPDHNPRFTVEVRLGDTVLGRGEGRSKKAAELQAARAALERLRGGS